jgi:hypothetical protein
MVDYFHNHNNQYLMLMQSYEYGSSQNRLSVISCPAGIFYISQNQGRIFSYGEGLTRNISGWFKMVVFKLYTI